MTTNNIYQSTYGTQRSARSDIFTSGKDIYSSSKDFLDKVSSPIPFVHLFPSGRRISQRLFCCTRDTRRHGL